ncbi:transposase [Flavobacterium sp.]|uniref:transposase n=1 Tax=Flavobacterium sp. TaxID=239 RepID=UPI0038D1C126
MSFTIRNESVKASNQFVWFKKWIIERQVYKYLTRDSGMSQSKLQCLFRAYLKEAPTVAIRSKKKVHLLIDGSYFTNKLCLILYYDHDIRYVQLYRETNQEKYREIKEDLENLKELGVEVYSVTCDGHKAILKAVRKAFPDVYLQRCLVHVKRQVKNYLSQHPKLPQSRALLQIAAQITAIKTHEQRNEWLKLFYDFYTANESFINAQSKQETTGRYWYTHKNLHAACSLLMAALPNMFCYLDDAEIPYTTNRLESYFSHLKEKLTLHRGLRFEAKKNFIKWYLHFKNNQSK